MSVFAVQLNNTQQGQLDLNPATGLVAAHSAVRRTAMPGDLDAARKALKEAEHLIKTVRSVGYMLSEK